MCAAPISDLVALRIAMAVRALPNMDARLLISILLTAVGQPLSLEKLSRLRLNRLKQAANGLLEAADESQLRNALDCLKGRGIELPKVPLPVIEPYVDGDLPDSIRIACCSDSGDNIDAAFGSCQQYLIYQVAAHEARLIAIRQLPELQTYADKHAARADLICDCHVLLTLSIGGPAAAKVVRAGLHPIKIAQAMAAPLYIRQLQQVLQASPPPWLAKAMGQNPEQRVRFSRACLA